MWKTKHSQICDVIEGNINKIVFHPKFRLRREHIADEPAVRPQIDTLIILDRQVDLVKSQLRLVATRVFNMLLRFQRSTLVGSNQRNYLENANACGKRTMKTRVATRL